MKEESVAVFTWIDVVNVLKRIQRSHVRESSTQLTWSDVTRLRIHAECGRCEMFNIPFILMSWEHVLRSLNEEQDGQQKISTSNCCASVILTGDNTVLS